MIVMKRYITKGYKRLFYYGGVIAHDALLQYRIHRVNHSLSAGRRLS